MTQGTVEGETQGGVMATVEEIVGAALNLANTQPVQTLDKLRAQLLETFPGQPQDVKAAIGQWALLQ